MALQKYNCYTSTIAETFKDGNAVMVEVDDVINDRLFKRKDLIAAYSNVQMYPLNYFLSSPDDMFIMGRHGYYDWGVSKYCYLDYLYRKLEAFEESGDARMDSSIALFKIIIKLINDGYNDYADINEKLKGNISWSVPNIHYIQDYVKRGALVVYDIMLNEFEQEIASFTTMQKIILAGDETLHFYIPTRQQIIKTIVRIRQ